MFSQVYHACQLHLADSQYNHRNVLPIISSRLRGINGVSYLHLRLMSQRGARAHEDSAPSRYGRTLPRVASTRRECFSTPSVDCGIMVKGLEYLGSMIYKGEMR